MKPGTPIVISATSTSEIFVQGKPVSPLPQHKKFFVVGLGKEDVALVYGPLDIYNNSWMPFSHPKREIFLEEIHVEHSKRRSAKLRIPSSVWKKVNDRHKKQKRIDREKMNWVLRQVNGSIQTPCWKAPLTSKVVSLFASSRTLPSGRSYYHSGVDLRAPTGTPIRAPSSGQVALAEHMVLPGNVVVLDHGGGLYSRYMHLSRFAVKPGDFVKQGEVIGRAGATGRVEGPHLHWEVVWKGNRANPHEFLESWEQICDQG